ncbi:MAG TPA: DUF1823 family protein [Candidatus Obscuribacterales bacterium]
MMENLPHLTPETIWDILNDQLDDDIVNHLIWHHLGYRFDPATQQWHTEAVEPGWAEKFPTPPNFIESRPATVQLTRAIPPANKQLLKEYLGFKGYRVDQLVPRLTRRATIANWLLSHLRQQGELPERTASPVEALPSTDDNAG